MTRSTYRFRLAVVSLVLVALAFVQDPGRIAADTKLDLTLNPAGFLGRALHLWDPLGFFGQVQNQAYGYFFPMGPFFVAGESLGLPGWVVQRLWWSLVLVTGFLGVVRLSRHLGVSAPLPRVLAGLAFVLGTRYLTTLGPISSETWAAALAPWALVPLVAGGSVGPRARGLRAGLPVLLAGAVNAVATLSLLVLPLVWLATRRWDRHLARLAGWWAAGVALACAWWLVPLVTLGSVSPPFLDWIESSAVTTRFTDLASVLRGSTSWVPYLTDPSGPVWAAGWQLVSSAPIVLAQVALATVGLVGLALWRGPDGWFLRLSLLAGLVLVGLGHVGPVAGLGAPWLRDLLDGPLAPLRNTHKFQPLVTLVLVVGLAGALQRARGWARVPTRSPLAWGAAAAVGAAILVVATPAWTGGLTRERSYLAVPSYWGDAAQWLAERGGQGHALVVPGAAFGDFLWGRSQDEPLQALARTPWAVRDAVPLSSAGNIRLLDEVEARIAAGQGSAGLAEALARSAVRYVVVRNDLDAVTTQAPRRALVRRALRQSPGLYSAATFGPPIQGFQTEEIVSAESQELPYPAVEIWEVGAVSAPDRSLAEQGAALRPLAGAAVLAGGPESLPSLGDAGLLDDAAIFLAGDAPTAAGDLAVTQTDTPRRTEVAFGLARENRSATMAVAEPFESSRRAHDYVVDGAEVPARADSSTPVATASASSERSRITAPRAIDPGSAARAAYDGDPVTAWRTPLGRAAGEWLRLDLGRTVDLTGAPVRVALVADGTTGAPPRTLRVQTEAGELDTPVLRMDALQDLQTPPGATSWVRVTLIDTVPDRRAVSFGVRELSIPGVPLGEQPSSPELLIAGGGGPQRMVLSARTGERGGCVLAGLANACDPTLARQGEDRAGLRRVIDVPGGAEVAVRVRPRPGSALDSLVERSAPGLRVSGSSRAVPDPAGRPGAVADRDLGTTWVAGPDDDTPTLVFRLPEPRRVSGVLFLTSPGAAASSPFQVTVAMNGRSSTLFTRQDGTLRFPAVTTSEVRVTFGFTSPRQGIDTVAGRLTPYPVGVGEVVLVGADDLRPTVEPGARVELPCGSGPDIVVGDQVVRTAVTTTVGALLDGLVVPATTCRHAPLVGGGEVTLTAAATGSFLVDQVALVAPRPSGAPPPDRAGDQVEQQPEVLAWSATERVLRIPTAGDATVLELGENANPGWRATVAGGSLEAVRVDGWRQGWVVPAGVSGEVVLRYVPDMAYRTGLAVGGLAALILLLLAAVPGNRLTGGPARGRLPACAPSAPVRTLAVAAGLALSAGLVGLLAGAAVAAGRPGPGPRARFVAGAGCLVGLGSAAWAWPQSVPGAVAAVVGGVAAVAVAAAVAPGWPRRSAGGQDPVGEPAADLATSG